VILEVAGLVGLASWSLVSQLIPSVRQHKGASVGSTLTTGFFIAVSLAAIPVSHAEDRDRVWVWSPRCLTPTKVALRVRLDGETIYATSLPLCRWERRFEKGKASFQFTPARPLVWYGYRSNPGEGAKDPGDTTPAGTTLEVHFWQAGGETDAIVLGYTVAASDGLHRNSLHPLSPTERRTSTMAPGLVLETWPKKKP
jgi:hypothetical protein